MKKTVINIIAPVCMLLCFTNLKGQLLPSDPVSTFREANFSPFGQNSMSNFFSNASLSSTLKEGENGKVELKYNRNFWTAGVTIDQKIGKNFKEASPFDLEGLSNGTKIEFNLQRIFWNPQLTTASFNNFTATAAAYANHTYVYSSTSLPNTYSCTSANSYTRVITDTLTHTNYTLSTITCTENCECVKTKDSTKIDARLVMLSDILEHGTPQEQHAISNIRLRKPVFVNVRYAFNKSSYTFVTDSITLASTDRNYITPSFVVSIGVPLSTRINNTGYLALTYNYNESYEVGDDYTVNTFFGSTSNTITRQIVFGAPQKKIDNRIGLECRINFNININSPRSFAVGLVPSVIYGIDSEKLSVTLPVYFINGITGDGKPNGLQAGMKFGYATTLKPGETNNFKDGFAAQLIVTAPFAMFSGF